MVVMVKEVDMPLLMEIAIPGRPVSTNRMYAKGRYGQTYLTKAAETWEQFVNVHARKWKNTHPRCPLFYRPTFAELAVCCDFYGVTGDADNYCKTTLDGLKYGIGIDDIFFTPVTATRMLSAPDFKHGVKIRIYLAQER